MLSIYFYLDVFFSADSIFYMINVITRENQSGAAGMWVLQPHHKHAPAYVRTGSGSPRRHWYDLY